MTQASQLGALTKRNSVHSEKGHSHSHVVHGSTEGPFDFANLKARDVYTNILLKKF